MHTDQDILLDVKKVTDIQGGGANLILFTNVYIVYIKTYKLHFAKSLML